MKIRFPTQLFVSESEKVSLLLPKDMLIAVDRLGEIMGMDRSKTIRWSVEQVLKEAIDQGKITPPPPTEKVAG